MALRVKVLSQYCKSCGYCVHYCPKKAISFGKERNGLGVFFPVVDEEKCISCGICATVCPDAALELREEDSNG